MIQVRRDESERWLTRLLEVEFLALQHVSAPASHSAWLSTEQLSTLAFDLARMCHRWRQPRGCLPAGETERTRRGTQACGSTAHRSSSRCRSRHTGDQGRPLHLGQEQVGQGALQPFKTWVLSQPLRSLSQEVTLPSLAQEERTKSTVETPTLRLGSVSRNSWSPLTPIPRPGEPQSLWRSLVCDIFMLACQHLLN